MSNSHLTYIVFDLKRKERSVSMLTVTDAVTDSDVSLFSVRVKSGYCLAEVLQLHPEM